MKPLISLLLVFALPAAAQVRPQPTGGDPHVQTVVYGPDQVVLLETALGYQLTVELGPDERIESAAVGDSGAWQVTASRGGNRLFIKPLQGGSNTNLTVITDARRYWFDLRTASGSDFPYHVRFQFPKPAGVQVDTAAITRVQGTYRLGGTRLLRPDGMHDDGVHTYIEWAPDRAIPAIYALNDQGRETLVNGMMRDGVMVIDSIHVKLVFRIDKRRATALRRLAEKH